MSSLKDYTKKKLRPATNSVVSIKDRWRDDFKGLNQVAGWVGKGKDQNTTQNHVPQPLQSLRDPATFGSPPRRLLDDNQISMGQVSINEKNPRINKFGKNDAVEQVRTLLPPPAPQRTFNKPKIHSQEVSGSEVVKPTLPPRLSSRDKPTLVPPLPSKSEIRLEGKTTNKSILNLTSARDDFRSEFNQASRLASMIKPRSHEEPNSYSSSSPPLLVTASNSQPGTTFSQKTSALKTISSLRSDPSSVSFSEAKEAAFTANNFRERHGDQVISGLNLANKVNNKYGISQKIGSSEDSSKISNEKFVNGQIHEPLTDILVKKRPPPPPPPPSRNDTTCSIVSPKNQIPSIPINTKPNWSPK
ncbi:putative altered inheritance of mitochondria protein 3 protein [Erysiphe necator]|uniref:Putative altered inheritance of mitochondria protein 3 protein n=1 Tax=Uncinula necator TaxID=52586 RepID=A0A0B1P898_UNCNE|nr:putative altered inheritance of mitochondria protein 3 protein [Erysiphe necator]